MNFEAVKTYRNCKYPINPARPVAPGDGTGVKEFNRAAGQAQINYSFIKDSFVTWAFLSSLRSLTSNVYALPIL